MLKKVITAFLGSMAAIWLSIALFFGIIFIGVIMYVASMGVPDVQEGTYLYIRLADEIPDRRKPMTLEDYVTGVSPDRTSMAEILVSLDKAKDDPRIIGVYLDCVGSSMSMAMREELCDAIETFKTSGKKVIAYADSYSQGDYYVASIADKIYLNPVGSVDVAGLSASVPFLKNALDKLGIEIQVIKVGTYKSAVEPYIMTSMSEPARRQYDEMLASMWKVYTHDVAAGLGMPDSTALINRMASVPMMAYTPDELIKAKIVTAKKYRYEVEQELSLDAGTGSELRTVSPFSYIASYGIDAASMDATDDSHVALVYAVGDIVDTGTEGIVGDQMSAMIIRLADDTNVRGLVLRVNSGGGSAFASEQIWASLEYFKSKYKPFVVSMGGAAASGGYYISCGADRIFADATTITGSIGIFGIVPYARELLNDKLGVNFDVVETNPNASFPRIDAPLTPAQHAALEKSIRNGYDLFVERVATGRNLPNDSVRAIAEGRVWVGSTAKKIGLVDELGGLKKALSYTAEKSGVDAGDYVSYPIYNPTPWDMLPGEDATDSDPRRIDAVSENTEAMRALGLTAKELSEGVAVLARIRAMGSAQAKMEDIQVR